jgi:hypothetical protein
MSRKNYFPLLFLVISILSTVVSPVSAGGTNCWGGVWRKTTVSGRYIGKALQSGRCPMPIFELINKETERNIRQDPTTESQIIGKLTNTNVDNYFLADLIVTIDNGRTYWAYGSVVSGDKSIYSSDNQIKSRKKGWLEIGNTNVVRQYDNPDVNDLWFKLP